MKKSALVIEDSPETRTILTRTLRDFNVFEAGCIADAEKVLKSGSNVDIILLDIDLPDGDGLKFFSTLRAHPEWSYIPTLVVSGQSSLPNKVTAFSLGAEDFVSKPFDADELRVRVQARIRKAETAARAPDTLRILDLELQPDQQRAYIQSFDPPQMVDLTAKEFRILAFMMRRFESVCSRESLLDEVWGPGVNVIDRTVDTHISHIRRKIAPSKLTIESSLGSGYRLVARQESGQRVRA